MSFRGGTCDFFFIFFFPWEGRFDALQLSHLDFVSLFFLIDHRSAQRLLTSSQRGEGPTLLFLGCWGRIPALGSLCVS